MWYEQGDLEYRKNNWGKLFPGATIDVYEWVGSTLLPSDWAVQADTTTGLTQGISGQPKFSDNSAISVKQVFDPITSTFSNVYYYWVKNKITIPNVAGRRISAYQVASVIADPTAYGLQYASIISSDAVALSNIGNLLVDSRVDLNIAQDIINTEIPMHTSWLLLQEGSESSMPNALLEQKLFDSLLGHDKLGNPVPDPTLTARTRYGIEVRPRQTMFINRAEALRNVFEFANSVLTATIITSNYDFVNLESQENYADPSLNLYDRLVEDNYTLDTINTTEFVEASIEFIVNGSGNVTGTNIVNAGWGYGILNPAYDNLGNQIGYQGPVFTNLNSPTGNLYGNGLEVSSIVNEHGQIISVEIVDQGNSYSTNFTVSPRPHTVVVLSDSTYNGKWSEFIYTNGKWLRYRTQQYNTTLYWNYVDWVSADYKPYKDFAYTVGNVYNLSTLDLNLGDYVKVLNGGNGNYIIVELIDPAKTQGTFSKDFNLLYSQNGTIKVAESLWNSAYGYNENDTYDQTLFDQTPDVEIEYILKALRDNLFINELRVNWNLLFFVALKYALSEQKLLDWAFKTSFISIKNNAVNLSQLPVYKLQDDTYYQQYLEEVKPYHTQIRSFITSYPLIDNSNSQFTDFDFPSYYDPSSAKFVTESVSVDAVSFNPVREMNVDIKFDRVSTINQIGSTATTDTFTADGFSQNYTLNWAAQPDKSTTKVVLGGLLVQTADYTLTTYTKTINGYHKQYTDVVFLNYTPSAGTLLKVTYNKSFDLYNAVERIYNLYAPTAGMPGVDPDQLMTGVSFPGTVVGGQYEGSGFSNPFGGFEPDSYIMAGTWSNGLSVDAFGIDPADFTLDGEYGFVTPNSSYAPEELVPGYAVDTLGINVYTKNLTGSPLIVTGNVTLTASANNTTSTLVELPTTIGSMSVVLNNQILDYSTTTNWTSSNQYSIDWTNSYIVIPPQNGGTLFYRIVGVGATGDGTSGVVDNQSAIISNSTSGQVTSVASLDTVKNVLVSLNGVLISDTPATLTPYYKLTYASFDDKRAAVDVYNLNVLSTYAIQAWFITSNTAFSDFNHISEQQVTFGPLGNGPTYESDGGFNVIPLSYPPSGPGPASVLTIVEIDDYVGRRQLLPPDVTYRTVSDITELTYTIDPVATAGSQPTLSTSPQNVNVYHNGLMLRPTFDYTASGNSISLLSSVKLNLNDTIAIETFNTGMFDYVAGSNVNDDFTYDYMVVGSNLYIKPNLQPNGYFITSATIKVVTYENANSLLLEEQRFEYLGSTNRFTLDRPVSNTDYTWVTVNHTTATYSLVAGVDYTIDTDNVTVIVTPRRFSLAQYDNIAVTSFSKSSSVSTVLAYRMFYDILGNTTFTRIGATSSTYLTRPLSYTDTQIYVSTSTALTPPDPTNNIPGVVLIDSERIEYFVTSSTHNAVILSQLRRGTLGTGPNFYVQPGTTVIDQGPVQILPYSDITLIQNTFTNTLTNQYHISAISTTTMTLPNTSTTVRFDGIVLPTVYTGTNRVEDVLEIYYGGKLLRKDGVYITDTTSTYDSLPLSNIVGSVSNLIALGQITTLEGYAYLVTSTNQVWVYTGNGFESDYAPGYIYAGMKYIPPDYTIDTSTQIVTLNTATIELRNNVRLAFVKTMTSATTAWNNNDGGISMSLMQSTSTIATFLQQDPAVLPDNYYYGGNPDLTDDSGFALSFGNDKVLTAQPNTNL